MKKNCIFCQIARGEIPTDFIYQDKDMIAFNDVNPLTPTHVLVIPREHIKGIQWIEKKDQAILGKMLLVAKKIAKKEKLKGYKLFFNCGKLGGQGIFHLHLHLVGGWKDRKEFHKLIKKRLKEGGVL